MVDGEHNSKIIHDELGITNIQSSLSHEGTHAIAFVLLEAEREISI